MLEAIRVTGIRQNLGQGLGQADAPTGLAQQGDAPIAGHVPAGETGSHQTLFYGWKLEEFRVTNCTGRSGVLSIHLKPIDIGPRTPLRFFSRKFSG
jgi:hypothetical protein